VKKYPAQVKAFGRVIKKIRLEKGISQQQLADDCDLERTTLTRIESGEMASTLHNVFALSEALNISAGRIFDQIEELTPPNS
jgi:transcriptional regulator with XRE-family HTH domain